MTRQVLWALVFSSTLLALGCAPSMRARRTGFLSDYSRLNKIDDDVWRWVDPYWDPRVSKGIIVRVRVINEEARLSVIDDRCKIVGRSSSILSQNLTQKNSSSRSVAYG